MIVEVVGAATVVVTRAGVVRAGAAFVCDGALSTFSRPLLGSSFARFNI